jgi:hypothetical protein
MLDPARNLQAFSAQALAAAGATPGAEISKNGVTWAFPDSAPGTPDNVAAAGQSITQTGSGSELWFPGAEAGFTSGQVKVTYTDGSTSTGSLGFPNWCCTDGTEYGATTVVTTDHRNNPGRPGQLRHRLQALRQPDPPDPGQDRTHRHPPGRRPDPRVRDQREVRGTSR